MTLDEATTRRTRRGAKFDPLNNWQDFFAAFALAPDEERAGWAFLARFA